ncbi:transposase [Streptomyces sp. NPDC047718]|uniref:transposase n=1 Tax=Streptomyces sp. NPDC047718 TaxID=3155479 RepID=UPI0033CF97B7
MHPGPFWSPSYFTASCGDAPLTVVRRYIEQQRRPLQLRSADRSGLPRPEGRGLRRAHHGQARGRVA